MNNREALKGELGFTADENAIEKALIDFKLSPDLAYDGSNDKIVKSAAKQVLKTLLSSADISNENGFRHSYDRDAISKRITDIEDDLEGNEGRPVIRRKNVW